MKAIGVALLAALSFQLGSCFGAAASNLAPVHPRPFLLPPDQRQQLLDLAAERPWAKKDLAELKRKAAGGDGYSAAFLYAVLGENDYLDVARRWLLDIGKKGGDLGGRALQADNEFFDQGMPWLGDVFYTTDTEHLEAFDYIHAGLTPGERSTIEEGLLASARFRQRAMDTWWQTPNLVFKPTSMVAIAGLVTQDSGMIDWGFFRQPESRLGGYFPALNNMLKDNGPWYEAPTYPIVHLPLALSLKISDYLSRMTGTNWFEKELENGSTVRGLMDYYVNTTYPREIRPGGGVGFRILTVGDGATGQAGDTFLLTRNPHQTDLFSELSLAYKISREPGYAGLLNLTGEYQPNLIDRPELPPSPSLPAAPSSIWPGFGLAFLRSDRTPAYWSNPDAMAASLLFRQGYGHGHADALSMTFFGAGQLFFPDYNAVQYENSAVGWTRNSVAHNTVMVDGADSSEPKSAHTIHGFHEGVSFVQAEVEELFGLRRRRTLALTGDYLLDVFHLHSRVPRTYDYLLHGFGRIEVDDSLESGAATPFSARYDIVRPFKAAESAESWSVRFAMDSDRYAKRAGRVIDHLEQQGQARPSLVAAFGVDKLRSFRPSALSFRMAGGEDTEVGYGTDPHGLSFLTARRTGRKRTTYIATHAPYYVDEGAPSIETRVLVDGEAASLMEVATGRHVDLHAVGHEPGRRNLYDPVTGVAVNFEGYALVRIDRQSGRVDTFGNVTGAFVPAGHAARGEQFSFGDYALEAGGSGGVSGESVVKVDVSPEIVVLKNFATSEFVVSITNPGDKPVPTAVELGSDPDIDIPERHVGFGSIPPRSTVSRAISLGRYRKTRAPDLLPFDVEAGDRTIEHGVLVSPGPGLFKLYDGVDEPVFRIHTFGPTIDFRMRDGFVNRVVDSNNNVVFSGGSLFGLSDGETVFRPENGNIEPSATWPNQDTASMVAAINNLVRWHTLAVQDRMYIRLDETYTSLDEVQFVFDASSPAFDWGDAVFLRGTEVRPLAEVAGGRFEAVAVELPFAGSSYGLCIKAQSERSWGFDGDLSLPIRRTDDQWGFGVCERGSLGDW